MRPPVRDLQGLECPNYLKALMPCEINGEEATLVSLQEFRNVPLSSCIGTLIAKDLDPYTDQNLNGHPVDFALNLP